MNQPHPQQPDAAALWSQLGQSFCITLTGRDDRKTHAQSQFQSVGLGDQIQFHIAAPHPSHSEQGIYESHIACLAKGLEAEQPQISNAGADTHANAIIVFEDDIYFQRFTAAHLQQVVTFIQQNHDWDILFLGGFVKASRATRWRGIRRIRYQCTAHAYVVSRDFAQQLIQRPWSGKAYDDMLRDLPDTRYFALYPAIGFQTDSRSDNKQTPVIDRVRRLCGGMARLQRLNELIHRHMTLLIVGHVVVLGLLIVLAIKLSRWLG